MDSESVRVTGVDMSTAMLEKARSKIKAIGAEMRAHLVIGSVRNLPFLDNTFDGVVMNQVLHHLSGPGDTPTPGTSISPLPRSIPKR